MENGECSLQVNALDLLVSLASGLWKGSEVAEGRTCSQFAWRTWAVTHQVLLLCAVAMEMGSSTRWLCPAGVGVSGRTRHQLLGKPKGRGVASQRFDLEIKAAVQDIRDCPGPLSALTELNAAVKEKFRHLRGRIQELEQMAKEQDKESEKQALLREVENHKKQMLSNQAAWRKANLACKIAIDNSEKDQLLQGRDSFRQRKSTKESLAESASNITESLMSISRMMSQQVQQSEETVQTLANSSRTILEANEEFKSMSGTIQLGRKLITKYNRRELTDKLLIFLALALFLATVLYILKKRLFPFL
ncbi:BCL2/adenovirus E1B 19kDa interacting protein 1 [Columba livia]|uniref:BCL2/adenovirus E1B 19kDa interacting protein 1 n=1 Tax=Columba livia TaxID=8932 RepID=A0A2I0LSU2_COLLI|nr:BCL2/adenovirus E1B 19kDa interacting protein 1 [Columba livia]